MTPMPTLALAALLGVLPWAAVQDTEPAAVSVASPFTIDLRALLKDIDDKAPRHHRHGVDAISGLADAVKEIVNERLTWFAKDAKVISGAWTFLPASATTFYSSELAKVNIPLDGVDSPNSAAGIRVGPLGVDAPILLTTSDVYDDGNAHKIKGFTRKTFGAYLPPGYRFRIATPTTAVLDASEADGVTVRKITAQTYVGAKSLARLEWRIPADRLKAGTVDAAGPEFLPYEGSLAKVSVALVAPGVDPAKIPAGDVILDVNADGQSVWAALQDRRPRINATTPSVLSLAAAPATQAAPGGLTVLVKEGSRITVDVDAAPAGWADLPRGAEVRVVAWFVVGLP